MADATETKLAASAEKAYAAATETTEAKPAAKAVESKTDAAIAAVKAEAPAAVVVKAVAAKPAAVKAPAKKVAAKKVAKVAAKKTPAAKTLVKKAVAKKPAAKTATAKPVSAPRFAATASNLKDTIMSKTQKQTEEFTARVQETLADVQGRAKAAYEKGTALFGEYGEFTKGNVEALVESSKILAAGVQDMGRTYVADSKAAFELVSADVKEIAAVRSPNEFFQLQNKLMRRNFDNVVAASSKNAEAVVKLANEAFAPISSRVSVAIEKVRKAA